MWHSISRQCGRTGGPENYSLSLSPLIMPKRGLSRSSSHSSSPPQAKKNRTERDKSGVAKTPVAERGRTVSMADGFNSKDNSPTPAQEESQTTKKNQQDNSPQLLSPEELESIVGEPTSPCTQLRT